MQFILKDLGLRNTTQKVLSYAVKSKMVYMNILFEQSGFEQRKIRDAFYHAISFTRTKKYSSTKNEIFFGLSI